MMIDSSGKLSAGSAALAYVRMYKGVSIYDATGDAEIEIWIGTSNSGKQIAKVAATDEQQSNNDYLPGNSVIMCPAGIYYTLTGGSSEARIFFEPVGGENRQAEGQA